MAKYYLSKYAIGIYQKETETETDELIDIYSSVSEMAQALGMKIDAAYHLIEKHFSSSNPDIRIDGKVREIHFINMIDEEN